MSQDTIFIPESQSVTIKMGKPLTFDISFNKPEVKTEIIYYTIYKTTNILKEDGDQYQFYVGKHKQYDNLDFDNYYGSGTILNEQIKEHGKENFKREFLEFCSSEKEMNIREVYWIASTSANCLIYPNCSGMNQTNGGEFYFGNSMKGENNPFYGQTHTQETKEKISKKKQGSPSPNKGKPMSDAQKIKISIKKMGIKMDETFKKIRSKYTTGEKNPNSLYKYEMSNNENYWEFFNVKERRLIKNIFNRCKTNTIIYKGIMITRVLKEEIKEFERKSIQPEIYSKYIYSLSNNEDYWIYFNEKERKIIVKKFSYHKSDTIIYKGITITRVLKDKGENQNG